MTDVREILGAYRDMTPVGFGPDFQLIEAVGDAGEPVLALLPGSAEKARREIAHARRVCGPGVVVPRPGKGRDAIALVELPGCDTARLLGDAAPLPPATLRNGLVVLLSTLSQAHARGLVHGRIGPDTVLADDAGSFLLVGWAGARDLDREEEDAADAPTIGSDLEALGRTFHPLLRDSTRSHHAESEATETGVVEDVLLVPEHGVTRDFTRVLSRLISQDPREVYRGAHEVLADLGEVDRSLREPPQRLPWEDTREYVAAVRHVTREAVRDADETDYVAAVEIVGPGGAGKTAVLHDIASAVRRDGGLVLQVGGMDPGAWGPFTSLTRQLLALAAPDTPVLSELDVEIRALLGEEGQVGDASGVVGGVAAALGDLLEAVFSENHGVVLLDDADRLDAPARAVWQSVIRWRHRRHLAADGVPLAFVTTGRTPAEEELGLPTRVMHLRPVEQDHLRDCLEQLLWEPELAADLAQRLHAGTDGWPRPLRRCWEDLVRCDVLMLDGERLHVRHSLDDAATWTDATVRALERVYERHGRHVRQLLEVLAVGDRVPLDRRTCAKLSELSGPSLWRAADAIEKTGLVERAGSGWRIASPSVRAKVYSGLPESRRHGLHRELLAHFRAADPSDLDAQALHARRSGHPDAGDLTERAIHACVERGDLKHAVGHVRDLEEHDAGAHDTPALWMLAAETLGKAGDVVEALRVTERALESGRLTLRDQLQIRLICARLELSFDRPGRVTDIEIPYCQDAEEATATLRWFRATAFAMLGDLVRAARESRLAEAELADEPQTQLLRFARARYHVECARLVREYEDAYRHQVLAVRAARRLDACFLYVEQLVRLTQLARLSENDHVISLLHRCEGLSIERRLVYSIAHTRTLFESTTLPEYKSHRDRPAAHPVDILGVCRSSAARAGATHLELILRFKQGRRHAMQVGAPPRALIRSIRSAAHPERWDRFVARVASYDALSLAIYYDDTSLMAKLFQTASGGHGVPDQRRVRDLYRAYRLYMDAEHRVAECEQMLSELSREYASGAIRIQERAPIGWLVAALIRTGRMPKAWTVERAVSWCKSPQDAWAGAVVRYALLIWRQDELGAAGWEELARSSSVCASPLPAVFEWQRLVVAGHVSMLSGDPEKAMELHERARTELLHLAHVSSKKSRVYFRRCLRAFRGGLALTTEKSKTRRARRVNRTRAESWLSRVVDSLAVPGRAMWLCVRDHRVVEQLARNLETRGVATVHGYEEALSGPSDSICVLPECWDELEAGVLRGSVLSGVPRHHATDAVHRVASSEEWLDRFEDGNAALGWHSATLAEERLGEMDADSEGVREFQRWCRAYAWPGGVREVGIVFDAVVASAGRATDAARRAVAVATGDVERDRIMNVIRFVYGHDGGRQMSELVWLSGWSRRSLQRSVRGLVEMGVLCRRGSGSGVTYDLDARSGPVKRLLVGTRLRGASAESELDGGKETQRE